MLGEKICKSCGTLFLGTLCPRCGNFDPEQIHVVISSENDDKKIKRLKD